jgi:membrane-bound serine protease (ClpP class)
MALYGTPPTPLLGSGIYDSVEDLARAEYGQGNYKIRHFETSWSETAAMLMEKAAPVLIGLGILALVVEFYTPGFGLPGITGLSLLAIVFIGNYIAGLAGNEPILFFAIGFLLLLLEILLFPGIVVMATTGILFMLGALVWSLADFWPKPGGGISVDYDAMLGAVWEVLLGVLIAATIFGLIYRFLPKSWVTGKLVLQGVSGGGTAMPSDAPLPAASGLPAPGSSGKAASNMRPSGTVEIDGTLYEATLVVGSAESGDLIVVTGYKNTSLLVQKKPL